MKKEIFVKEYISKITNKEYRLYIVDSVIRWNIIVRKQNTFLWIIKTWSNLEPKRAFINIDVAIEWIDKYY